jgi:DNA invertase Pin-like site-specific DNA recombinase
MPSANAATMVPFDGKAALQKPLDHVYARRIDVIVVYKVDRLTCALAEFAKLSSWSTRAALSSFR